MNINFAICKTFHVQEKYPVLKKFTGYFQFQPEILQKKRIQSGINRVAYWCRILVKIHYQSGCLLMSDFGENPLPIGLPICIQSGINQHTNLTQIRYQSGCLLMSDFGGNRVSIGHADCWLLKSIGYQSAIRLIANW
jgi:hypothetical protein